MPENWRGKQGFAYDVEVRCGGCLRYVHEVYAVSREAGAGEKGRCRDCVAASPVVVEAEVEPVVVVEGEAEEEGVVGQDEGNLCPDCGTLLSQYGCPVCGEQNAPEEAAAAPVEEAAEEEAKAVDPVKAKEAAAAYPDAAEEAPDPVAEEEGVLVDDESAVEGTAVEEASAAACPREEAVDEG